MCQECECPFTDEFLLGKVALRRTREIQSRIVNAEEEMKHELTPAQWRRFIEISDMYCEEQMLAQLAVIEFLKRHAQVMAATCSGEVA